MEKLLERLKEIDFDTMDIDELLDNRDCKPFDAEWNRIYKEICKFKKEKELTADQKKYSGWVSEKAFMTVYDLSRHGELAGYVSDDFSLMTDCKLMGFSDEWLTKLIGCYQNGVIPSGELSEM